MQQKLQVTFEKKNQLYFQSRQNKHYYFSFYFMKLSLNPYKFHGQNKIGQIL